MFTDWTIAKNLVVKPVVGFDVWEGERLLQHDKIALYVLTWSKPFLIVMHLKCSLSFNQTAVCIKRSCVHQVSQKLLRMQNKSQPSYLSECKCTMKRPVETTKEKHLMYGVSRKHHPYLTKGSCSKHQLHIQDGGHIVCKFSRPEVASTCDTGLKHLVDTTSLLSSTGKTSE